MGVVWRGWRSPLLGTLPFRGCSVEYFSPTHPFFSSPFVRSFHCLPPPPLSFPLVPVFFGWIVSVFELAFTFLNPFELGPRSMCACQLPNMWEVMTRRCFLCFCSCIIYIYICVCVYTYKQLSCDLQNGSKVTASDMSEYISAELMEEAAYC